MPGTEMKLGDDKIMEDLSLHQLATVSVSRKHQRTRWQYQKEQLQDESIRLSQKYCRTSAYSQREQDHHLTTQTSTTTVHDSKFIAFSSNSTVEEKKLRRLAEVSQFSIHTAAKHRVHRDRGAESYDLMESIHGAR